ncbi:hypothetical protein BT96DRAFT_928202 [Gymnopus androsaceus JB14]|uniref:Uncharacterized protein n=1 Tax=Gymnopus androsaceus JB14 TaxID=1447944 RepID=A0A6A4GMA1_9AGAR|nr:hypothetical protein BT96DRAFT_928202 [Gymnopus androsaceus JB14]
MALSPIHGSLPNVACESVYAQQLVSFDSQTWLSPQCSIDYDDHLHQHHYHDDHDKLSVCAFPELLISFF